MSKEDKTFEDELAELDLQLDADLSETEDDEDLSDDKENDENANDKDKEENKAADDDLEVENSSETDIENNSASETSEDASESESTETKPTESDRIKELMARIDVLQGRIPITKVQKTDTKSEDKQKVLDFLKDLELDTVHSDPKIFNQVLHQVATFACKQAEQNILANIPDLLQGQISESLSAREMADKFYADNDDLKNVRNVVKACAEQVAQENSDWTVEKVLNEAAVRTRKTLGITVQAESDLGDPNKAGFVKTRKSGGKRNKQQKISALQQELDEL